MSSSDSEVVDNPQPTTSSGSNFSAGVFFKKTVQTRKRSRVVLGDFESDSDIAIGDDSDNDPDYTLPAVNPESSYAELHNVSDDHYNDPNVSQVGRRPRPSDVDFMPSDVGVRPIEGGVRPNDRPSDNNATPQRPKRVVVKKGRSLKLNVEGWEKNVAKSKRNKGESYVSYGGSKKHRAGLKKLGPQCKDGCFEKVSMEKVNDILDAFWAIGDYDKQNVYIAGCISEERFKRKYTKKETSQREVKTVFKVMHSGVSYTVCRKGFMAMHGMTRDRVELVVKKKKSSVSGTPSADQRGRRPNIRKIVGPQADFVHKHISNLPVTTSHYSRIKNPHRQYLVATEKAKTIPELYQNYRNWMHAYNPEVPIVLESYYRHIFTSQYNIEFTPPKKDVCNTCLKLDIKIKDLVTKGQDVAADQSILKEHKDKAKVPRDLLRQHIAGKFPGVRAIAIDLQQTLPYPKLSANKAYYLRKLWLYNFCVFDTATKTSHMFLWDETQGARGAIEIGSCILQWLEEVYEEPFNSLRIFADNCGGQNKNIHIVLMLLQQIHNLRLKKVDLIFMVSGHSFLPCDQSFGNIEKAFRREAEIETVDLYVALMKKSMADEKVKVHRLDRSHFKDIKILFNHITRRSVKGLFKKASQIVLSIEESYSYRLKHDYHLENHSSDIVVPLQKGRIGSGRGRGRPAKKPAKKDFSLCGVVLPQKYTTDRVLQPEKLKDLKTLLTFMYVPNRPFLEGVFSRQSASQSSSPSRAVEVVEQTQEDEEDDSEDENDATTWEENFEVVRRVHS